MTFQLVRASDTEIAIWQTEHGHIYIYSVAPDRDRLERWLMRAAPDAGEPPETFAEDALRFATAEAKARQLIGAGVQPQNSRSPRAGSEPVPFAGG